MKVEIIVGLCIAAVVGLLAYALYMDHEAQIACKLSKGKWTQTGSTMVMMYTGKVMIPTWVPIYECLH